MDDPDYDVIVIGSGFGGSVAALRLTEKGYRVAVAEAGQRFDDPAATDPRERHRALPRNSWRTRRYLWAPALGLTGIQRIHLLRGRRGARVLVLAGAGVGGGSLVYANTLYEPPRPFFDDRQWRHITDWRAELAPYYDQARRMLGVTDNPAMTPADEAVARVAERMGRADTFRLTPVGVHFGTEPGAETADPYFGGAGPRRVGCTQCGSCMTGCRTGAKNMLTENYLYLAERAGARVIPMTTVTAVRPSGGGYLVDTVATGPRAAWPWTGEPEREPGGVRGRDLRHAEAAAPDAGHRHVAGPVRPPGRADQDKLRGHPGRRAVPVPGPGSFAWGGHHLVIPS
jgi:cholesterol oxidase